MLAVLLLALPGAGLVAAPTLSVAAHGRGDALAADLSLTWDQPHDLLASLEGGLESQIVFSARLCEPRTGAFALFGDRVVTRVNVVRRAYLDILTQRYMIDEDGKEPRGFATTDALLEALFTAEVDFRGPVRPGAYVAARVQVEPVRLMPPLSLVTLAGRGAFATPWVRSDLP